MDFAEIEGKGMIKKRPPRKVRSLESDDMGLEPQNYKPFEKRFKRGQRARLQVIPVATFRKKETLKNVLNKKRTTTLIKELIEEWYNEL